MNLIAGSYVFLLGRPAHVISVHTVSGQCHVATSSGSKPVGGVLQTSKDGPGRSIWVRRPHPAKVVRGVRGVGIDGAQFAGICGVAYADNNFVWFTSRPCATNKRHR